VRQRPHGLRRIRSGQGAHRTLTDLPGRSLQRLLHGIDDLVVDAQRTDSRQRSGPYQGVAIVHQHLHRRATGSQLRKSVGHGNPHLAVLILGSGGDRHGVVHRHQGTHGLDSDPVI